MDSENMPWKLIFNSASIQFYSFSAKSQQKSPQGASTAKEKRK